MKGLIPNKALYIQVKNYEKNHCHLQLVHSFFLMQDFLMVCKMFILPGINTIFQKQKERMVMYTLNSVISRLWQPKCM